MRTHVDTHPDFDFAIGYARPKKPRVTMCEDCRQRPARRGQSTCFGCGKKRERIADALMGTLGRPFA